MEYDLVFDTETNGALTATGKLDVNNQRLVQLAWILSYSDGTEIKKSRIVSGTPTIYYGVPHNITMDVVKTRGVDFAVVVDEFVSDALNAKKIIGHNVSFDMNVIVGEMIRRRVPYERLKKAFYEKKVDTMRIHRDICKLPFYKKSAGFKNPKLEEVYGYYFGRKPAGALHDALYDCEVTLTCYREYKKLRI